MYPEVLKINLFPTNLKKFRDPGTQQTLIPLTGMYQCKKALCLTCKFVQHGQKSFTVKGKMYPINKFYNCSTEYVLYCLTCPCGLFYVGRTIGPLCKLFGEHRRFLEGGSDQHSVPRHYFEHHQQSTAGLKVWIIEAILASYPTAEHFKRLCQQKTFLDIFP